MRVVIIGHTTFLSSTAEAALSEDGYDYDAGGSQAQDLIEFAGRACYQSWKKPNPATATNRGYLEHILDVKHSSVLEHGSVTVYVTGVSRSLTHELVRHRHHSPSQLSQRFVITKPTQQGEKPRPGVDFIVPPLFEGDDIAETILTSAWEQSATHYDQLIERAEQLLDGAEGDRTSILKRAREAARAVLPNMTPTAIVVTGNHRAWREAISKRAKPEADAETCQLFVRIFKELRVFEPNVYQDMHVMNNGDRDWVCECPALTKAHS